MRKGDHVRGIARHVYRERTLFRVQRAMKRSQISEKSFPLEDEEVLGPTPPEDHHHISKDIRHKVDVPKWLADNRKDKALEVCGFNFFVIVHSFISLIRVELFAATQRSSPWSPTRFRQPRCDIYKQRPLKNITC